MTLGKRAALLLACLLGAGLCLTGPFQRPDASAVIPSLLLLWCEARAVKLPGAGLVSVSFAPLLALGLAGQSGPACLLWLAAVTLRQLGRGHPSLRLREALWELTPGLPALAIAQALLPQGLTLAALGACLVMLSLRMLLWQELARDLPDGLSQIHRTVQGRLVYYWPGLAATGVLMVLVRGPAVALFWPLLEMLRSALAQAVRLEEHGQRKDVLRQLHKSQTQLEQAYDRRERLEVELERQLIEVRDLEAASRPLLYVQDRQQTIDAILALCRGRVQCTSLAVFVHDGSDLVPVGCSSPLSERVGSAALAGLREPAVDRALASGCIQSHTGNGPERIFANEGWALAFPLSNLGVLYAGKRDQPFSEGEMRSLGQAALQGGLALRIAGQLEALQQGLQQQSALSQQLKSWADSVDWLLRQSLPFLDQLEVAVVVERLTLAVRNTFPHDSLEVSLAGSHPLPACQSVLDSRRPLLVDDLETSRFQGHRPGQRSLLCVPLFHAGLPHAGLIVLGAEQPGCYTRQHQDLLSILGYLAGTAWKNAELHAEMRAAQAQLVQAGKMAAVGNLAAGIAHEINTPLTSISLNLDMAKRQLLSDAAGAGVRLDRAQEMVEKARAISDSLLYYSRQAEAGRQPTDLNRLVEDTLQILAQPLSLDGAEVRFTPGATGPVEVNSNEIQQVLFNLLLNARDATRSSPHKLLQITTEQCGGEALLSVRDQGSGIAPQDLERIFDPFFTTKPVGEGTGLGLSISQQIVQAHGGSLRCHSVLGEGTRFEMRLPLSSG